ncbi:hypothetical protein HMPREF9372_2250 [Sporosarcina newyorkensis 2681]|uniref:Uncharacterized protein n=1 Tax=Sporosarcina newyorkensis 2681 TaxID=1027292 RepID=F9DTW9_9BACL|nr:hypothetical protein HMPREF9372_2250 [Sporosarcina newyorkensis 2681]
MSSWTIGSSAQMEDKYFNQNKAEKNGWFFSALFIFGTYGQPLIVLLIVAPLLR